MGLEYRFGISPAVEDKDGDIAKSHGCIISLGIFGEKGGVEFNFHTGWYTGAVNSRFMDKLLKADDVIPISEKVNSLNSILPKSLGVTIHSKKPLRGFNSSQKHEGCPVTGGDCWLFVNFTEGAELLNILIEKGHNAVYERLIKSYEKDIPE